MIYIVGVREPLSNSGRFPGCLEELRWHWWTLPRAVFTLEHNCLLDRLHNFYNRSIGPVASNRRFLPRDQFAQLLTAVIESNVILCSGQYYMTEIARWITQVCTRPEDKLVSNLETLKSSWFCTWYIICRIELPYLHTCATLKIT